MNDLDSGSARAKRVALRSRFKFTLWVQDAELSYELPADTRAMATQMATNLTARPALGIVAVSVRAALPSGETRLLELHPAR